MVLKATKFICVRKKNSYSEEKERVVSFYVYEKKRERRDE